MEDNNENNSKINQPDFVFEGQYGKTCPHCKSKIVPKNDVCPQCGHYLYEKEIRYQPLNPKTTKKIKLILGIALIAVFIILVATGVVKLEACQTNA